MYATVNSEPPIFGHPMRSPKKLLWSENSCRCRQRSNKIMHRIRQNETMIRKSYHARFNSPLMVVQATIAVLMLLNGPFRHLSHDYIWNAFDFYPWRVQSGINNTAGYLHFYSFVQSRRYEIDCRKRCSPPFSLVGQNFECPMSDSLWMLIYRKVWKKLHRSLLASNRV